MRGSRRGVKSLPSHHFGFQTREWREERLIGVCLLNALFRLLQCYVFAAFVFVPVTMDER